MPDNDDRTDKDARDEDMDGMPLFTAATSPGDPYHPDDVTYAYRDMRAQWWMVKFKASGTSRGAWTATPTRAAAEFYGIKPKVMYAAASDAKGLIDVVEEKIEAARVDKENAKRGGWIVLLVIGGLLLLADKKGKR